MKTERDVPTSARSSPPLSPQGRIRRCRRSDHGDDDEGHRRRRPRWEVARLALASRLILLASMSISNAVLPDFHPGDDVPRFDMRMIDEEDDDVVVVDGRPPSASSGRRFCLPGHACEHEWGASVGRRRRRGGKAGSSSSSSSSTCESSSIDDHVEGDCDPSSSGRRRGGRRVAWLDRVYALVLPPLTRWDASRFLSLSVNPWARHPPRDVVRDVDEEEEDPSSSSSGTSTSEMSHAFFPLWPLVVRASAGVLITTIPASALPPTYESTSALAAAIVNVAAFVVAAVCLYDATYHHATRAGGRGGSQRHLASAVAAKEEDDDRTVGSSSSRKDDGGGREERWRDDDDDDDEARLLATLAARLFCLNPAGVFFSAAYSESLFAMLTFAGHAVVARGRCCSNRLPSRGTPDFGERTGVAMPPPARRWQRRRWWWCANFHWIPSTALWMMASYARSNGTFSVAWWILVGLSRCVSRILASRGKKEEGRRGGGGVTIAIAAVGCLSSLLFHGTLAYLVAYPVLYHDQRGYEYHCRREKEGPVRSLAASSTRRVPAWCDRGGMDRRRFSLYAHVQRKYWNVGLFRYYEARQIPNFVLALPVLALSFAAVSTWIARSWDRHGANREVGTTGTGVCGVAVGALRWVFLAMDASSGHSSASGGILSNASSSPSSSGTITLLLGPELLPHYAVLAGFALVGAFVAHVQVSTRLIFSSCPAIYWFLSDMLARSTVNDQKGDVVKGCSWQRATQAPWLVYSYFALYNILGVIMHVNWLPWT
jgi:phosphatidylinositol glycan class V